MKKLLFLGTIALVLVLGLNAYNYLSHKGFVASSSSEVNAIAGITNLSNKHLTTTPTVATANKPNKNNSAASDIPAPSIELIFCLDATGSMSGLIHTAKEKIWEIVTVLTETESASNIELGMVFYRDRGDEFVTKKTTLTTNIDSVYNELLAITASGGGDTPESVNQGLNEAVTQMQWGQEKQVYKAIFLVGDCPPHQDYKDDVPYSTTCELAKQQDIFINTIKLGTSCSAAKEHFKAIADKTAGTYLELGINADDRIYTTAFDDSIAHYSKLIDASKIYYGSQQIQSTMNQKKESSLNLYDKSSKNAITTRAKFNNSKVGKTNFYGHNELITDIVDEKVNINDISESDLPEELKEVAADERLEQVKSMVKNRAQHIEKLKELTKKRDESIIEQKKQNKDENGSSFSEEIFSIVQKQAALKGITINKR